MRGQGGIRDKLLILAGVTAAEIDHPDVAAECRQRILEQNPQHLIRRWPNFSEALDDDEFQVYLKQQLRRYSPERVEHLLAQLGIEPYSAGEFSLGDGDFVRLMDELDSTEPDSDESDPVASQRVFAGGVGSPRSGPRPYLPLRRHNRLQPYPTLWLVVLLGLITCAIYIGLALSG
jgi:hypothetical protein